MKCPYLLLPWWIATHVLADEGPLYSPMPDGTLVHKHDELRHQAGQWSTIIVFEYPEMPPQINELMIQINEALRSYSRVSNDTSYLWQYRWTQLVRLQHSVRLRRKRTRKDRQSRMRKDDQDRHKRGLIDAGGWILNKLFGVATQDDINKIKNFIRKSQKRTDDIVHVTKELVTVVKNIQGNVQANRRQLQVMQEYVRKLSYYVRDRLSMEIETMRYRIYCNKADIKINALLSMLEETLLLQYRRVMYFRKLRAAIELGRLTEDVLPPEQLDEIARLAAKEQLYLVDKVWYYEHVVVYPLYLDDKRIVYSANLPLVNNVVYHQYEVKTWPVYYNDTDTAIQLVVPEVLV